MFFGLIVLLTGLTISAISAYYSIIGLTAIFAAAFWPIVIMGGVLEVGKIVSTVWLHINWKRAPWRYKAYLVPAVVTLMLITSMGIFGFLSKAHLDQTVPSGDIAAQVSILDEKIKTQRDNITVAKKAIEQMNTSVDQLVGRSDDEKGVERSLQVRRSQAKERATLTKEIETAQKEIVKLQEQRAPIASQLRKVEAEVGPVKYIAALIYGDNPDTNLLERAVRWVIIIIVFVFDPLAIVLILAATMSLEWWREDRRKKKLEVSTPTTSVLPQPEKQEPKPIIQTGPNLDEVNKQLNDIVPDYSDEFTPPPPEVIQKKEPKIESVVEAPAEQPVIVKETPSAAMPYRIPETAVRTKIPPQHVPEAMPHLEPVADNVPTAHQANASFGTTFPTTPDKGDVFLRVDYLPSRLFKWDGANWIEINKQSTDSYAYDDGYIAFLIKQIDEGKYDVDDLSSVEQEQIKQYLTMK